MQIYLNIFKKSKIINYKDNIFLWKLNNFLLVQFAFYLLLQFSTFSNNKLSKLLLLALIKQNDFFLLNFFHLPGNFFFFNTIEIIKFFKLTVGWQKTKKSVYPVLKSPFIYKKAFRHFSAIEYCQQICYSGKINYLQSLLKINPIKFELTNSLKTIRIIENQVFWFN